MKEFIEWLAALIVLLLIMGALYGQVVQVEGVILERISTALEVGRGT